MSADMVQLNSCSRWMQASGSGAALCLVTAQMTCGGHIGHTFVIS
jgi:hypothetical protein